jgi:hypothetical protein
MPRHDQGAASTTSKAIVWLVKSGWLASQYCAARTMRRLCFAGSVQAASSFDLRRLTSTKTRRLPLRHEIDLADGRAITLRHDAVAFEPKN